MHDNNFVAKFMIARDTWMRHDACDWLTDNGIEYVETGQVWAATGETVAGAINSTYPGGARQFIIDMVNEQDQSAPFQVVSL